jgi:ubiquinone/menaquinone biosynthesis C-methylase UbiE
VPVDNWREFYSAEAGRYEGARYGSRYGRAFRMAHRDLVQRLLGKHAASGLALDIASGTGQLLPCIVPLAESVIACDLTPEMLHVSRRIHASPAVAYMQADALRLPFADATFDLVASSRFLHLFPLESQEALLREMARVVKPGGLVVVDVYNRIARKLLQPAIAVYRRVRGKRSENDHYSSPAETQRMLRRAGLVQVEGHGVGSYFSAPLVWLPAAWLARLLRSGLVAGKATAEQWVVVGRRE